MRTSLASAALGLLLLCTSRVPAGAEPPAGGPRILAHRIEARFEPTTHRLVARDVLTLEASPARRSLVFHLAPALAVSRVEVPGGSGPLRTERGTEGRWLVDLPPATAALAVSYAGEVFDAVKKSEDLTWVVGDDTRGVISEKGVYLSGASAWYPRAEGDVLARFDVTTWVPEPFLVVTQGGLPERSRVVAPKGWASDDEPAPPAGEGGTPYARSAAVATIATDDLSLSAGPYVTSTSVVEGVTLTTYFLEKEAPDAPLWLASAEETVRRYAPILGRYPHAKFDVVENFFQSGYGMPSYTLLGDEVIRYVTQGAKRPGGKIPPGYLDHEYVHGWFGNGLFVDPRDGNWCEALTTYYSNYLAKELESAEAGLEHRRGVLEKYAIRVTGDRDYPVRSFRSKTEDADNDVGYGKGSLVFHMLRRRLGDATFFDAVRRACETRVGTYVSWTDWLAALDGEWVRPWIERKGLPEVRLAAASAWPGAEPGTWTLRVEATQSVRRGEEPWPAMDLEVSQGGGALGTMRLEGPSAVWTGTVRGDAAAVAAPVELDAGHHVLRRVADDDLPPCLNRTFETRGAQVAWPDGVKPLADLGRRLVGEKRLARAAADAAPTGPRVDLLVHRAGDLLAPVPTSPPPLAIGPDARVQVDGKTFEGADVSVVFSLVVDGFPRTWYVALSEEAAARAKYVTFYGWDQYVVFKAGRPVARGFLSREPRGTRRAVAVGAEEAARVLADVTTLCRPEYEGRRPGTPGHDAAATWLAERLAALGFAAPAGADGALSGAFGLGVADLVSPRDLVLTTAAGTEVVKDAFRPLFNSPEREGGKPLPFAEGAGAVQAPGKLPDTSPAGLAELQDRVDVGVAPALLLAPTAEARRALAAVLDAPNALTPDAEAEFAKPGRGGTPAKDLLRERLSGRRARAFPDARVLRVPVLVLEEHAVERLEREPAVKAIDFAVAFGPERAAWAAGRGGRNVLGVHLPPALAKEARPPVVVVSAHYDSHGRVGDALWCGPDDNASGVACVLEAARGLAAAIDAEAAPRAGVVVCLFDGEEWGLLGSRALVGPLAKAYDVRAVVNVDSVGRVREDRVHVVGLSTVPPLAGKVVEALASAGLSVGRDIDKFAYEGGSDHWPFHVAGVPAVDLYASDYAVMDSARDTLPGVDPVGVARLSAALRAALLRLVRDGG